MSLALWLPPSVHLISSRLGPARCAWPGPRLLAFGHVYASQSLASLVGGHCGVDLALRAALRGLLRLLSDVFDIALAFWLLLLTLCLAFSAEPHRPARVFLGPRLWPPGLTSPCMQS